MPIYFLCIVGMAEFATSICHMAHFWVLVLRLVSISGNISTVLRVLTLLIADIVSPKDDLKCPLPYSLKIILFTSDEDQTTCKGLLCNGTDMHTINMEHVIL